MQLRSDVKPALAAATIFFSTGLSIASLSIMTPRYVPFGNGYPTAGAFAFTSPVVLLCACVLVFFRPTLGYVLGGIAGLMALPWLILTEPSIGGSTWNYLNIPGPDYLSQFDQDFRTVAILRILSVALLATTLTCSVLRVLPSVLLRKSHLSGRVWPAIVVGVVVPITWLCHSAMPWMLPGIVDRGSSADLRILHVEKRGLRLHETSIGIGTRDARFSVSQYDRRLFQFRFQDAVRTGVMPEATRQRADDLLRSPKLRDLHTAPATALRSWNAEGWYIWTSHISIQAFTSEYGTTPPTEVIDLMAKITKLPGGEQSPFVVQDICLGFCYDPPAGLGFVFWNDRCGTLQDGTTRCR